MFPYRFGDDGSTETMRRRRLRHALGLLTAGVLAVLVGNQVIAVARLDALSSFMGTHVVLMNAAAPFLAMAMIAWLGGRTTRLASPASLAAATLTQLLVLGASHVPAGHAALDRSGPLPVLQACLLAASIWFWLAVLGTGGAGRWRSLLALLVTGKAVCLMAAILVLAPRPLFVAPSHATGDASLADQHLAGLLMLAACPLTYVLAGVVIAAQWLADLGDADDRAGAPAATKHPRAA